MTADLSAIMRQFRRDVKFLMRELGVREAAKQLDTSATSLYAWEKPDSNPRQKTIRRVLKLAEEVRADNG